MDNTFPSCPFTFKYGIRVPKMHFLYIFLTYLGFPGSQWQGLIPGLERFPGVGKDNSLQYSCLENSMDREAWRTTVHGVKKSRTWLSDTAQNSKL